MSRWKGNVGTDSLLINSHYERSVKVSDKILSTTEIFTLTVVTSCLYFEHSRNDFLPGNSLKTIGITLWFLIAANFLRKVFWGVKLESVFVVKSLGLQTTTVYHSKFRSSKFIPWHSINDVVINEAIVMQKVIFYLAVLVKTENAAQEESIIPILTHAPLRLSELKEIYMNIQLILKH